MPCTWNEKRLDLERHIIRSATHIKEREKKTKNSAIARSMHLSSFLFLLLLLFICFCCCILTTPYVRLIGFMTGAYRNPISSRQCRAHKNRSSRFLLYKYTEFESFEIQINLSRGHDLLCTLKSFSSNPAPLLLLHHSFCLLVFFFFWNFFFHK